MSDLSYDLAIMIFTLISQIFFREVRTRGSHYVPRTGPVIFVAAPHNNQFLDLLLGLEIYKETGRRAQFLIAAASMKRRVIGAMAKLLHNIPVARAQDSAKPGSGTVRLFVDDPCLVLGKDTRFQSELSPRMTITLPKDIGYASSEVVEVLSDTEVRVKREFKGESDVGTAQVLEAQEQKRKEGADGFSYKCVPYVSQEEMFRQVYRKLDEGGSIAVFPEGGSHDRTDFLPFKVGFALMALGAMANNPGLQVKIQPAGMYYFHAHRFRSRAVIDFGQPLDVPQEYVEMFKRGGAEKREAVGKLVDTVYDALKAVTIRAPDFDTLQVIQAARRLYIQPGQHLTIDQVVKLSRRLLEAYFQFKDEPRIQQLRKDILSYNARLRRLGLRDHQVPRAEKDPCMAALLLVYRSILLSVWSVFALPGTVLNGPIFILASIISLKKSKEALAASQVKVAGKDVLATWKVLVALVVTPVLYAVYAILGIWLAIRAGATREWIIATPFIVSIVLPLMNFAALKFGEAGMDVLKSLPPLIVSLVPGQQKTLVSLKRTRQELSERLTEVINDLGPQIYEDFGKDRILDPAASAPPATDSDANSLRQRKNSGWNGEEASLLDHPMTWLDERLFGWTRPEPLEDGDAVWGDHDETVRR
ncbi:hypothetical protein BD626DRAFT_508115 [Schizophyllum amplum]|uniref:Phospholipid/glycerol acyltransferase domain-containing protein n=1 Tax=Schizophyllum amplum TaxID=97359 RepID=A0A550C3M2_9AGAR|nr:hypothetical protein BD626DRAFT_508115 [Auriculariopsis ampla]